MVLKWLTISLFYLPLANPLSAQTHRAILSGFVYAADSGEALINCTVYLEEIQRGTTTNHNGFYTLPQVPAGTYTLICSYIGYKPHVQSITLATSEEKRVRIDLQVQAQEIAEFVVVADSVEKAAALYRKPLSLIELSSAQIDRLPQVVEADLLRSLQTLPGIAAVSDYSSAPYIRGGTPDQNLYLIDGTDVYNPEHAFGLFSIFNTDALKKVEVHKGGFGAEYGGRLSSVLNITHLDGNKREFEGTAALSLLSAKTTIQMPLRGRGSFSASFRRTYFDQTVARAIDSIPPYFFYDGNFKAFIDLNATNKLTISGFAGRDFLDVTFNRDAAEEAALQYDWGNRTGSVRWSSVYTPRLFANFWITGSRFTSAFDLDQIIGFTESNKVSDLTLKGDLEYSHSPTLSSRFGFEQKNLHVVYRQTFPDARTDIGINPTHYALFLTTHLKSDMHWEAETGLRYHFFDSDRNFNALSPRFSFKYRLSPTVSLKAATGLYHQYLNRIPRVFITDIWTAANEFQRGSTARHFILGYHQELAPRIELEVEAYHKDYDDIHVFNEAFLASVETDIHQDGLPIFIETVGLFHEGDGDTRGFEVLLKKQSGNLKGWMGSTLSKTRYAFHTVNRGMPFPPRHDKTATINAVASLDLANSYRTLKRESPTSGVGKWLLGLNFIYASGQAITRPGSGYIANSLPDFNGTRNLFTGAVRDFAVLPGPINRFRLPAYIRLDLSLKYRTRYRSMDWTTYLQIFNVGNRRNVWFIQYRDESEGGFDVIQDVDTIPMFPILPTLGAHISF